MAEVFDIAEGMGAFEGQLERVIALHTTVQRKLDLEAAIIFAKAEALMAEHHETGNAFISKDEGDVDRGIWLEDPPTWKGKPGEEYYDQGAALAIEMRLKILQRASGLSH